MLPYFELPFDHRESLVGGDYIVATYLASGLEEEKVFASSGGFAVGQSLGTWLPVPGITRDMVTNHQARLVGCYPVSLPENGQYLLQIAFPFDNFGTSFTGMLTALVGNDASTAINTRLIDLELIGKACEVFPGPRHGIVGLRRLTGVTGRPIVLNMIKPCIGYSPDVGAELFYASARGGVDLIKDDELLSGATSFSTVEARVKANLAASQRVLEETGKAPVYLPNISHRPRQMRDNARAALEAGAKGVMVNFVPAGFDVLAELVDEFGQDLVFLGHFAGAGVMVNGNTPLGISAPVLLGLLPRLAGADAVITMYAAGRPGPGHADLLRTVQAHRLSLAKIRPVMSAVGGGVTPLTVPLLYQTFGPDTIIAVGGGIQGHPDGAAAGGRAMMQAVGAAVDGRELTEAATECPELRRALEYWGG